MITPFKSSASGTSVLTDYFLAAKLVSRSTQSADTGNVTLSGLDGSAVAYSETVALLGRREVSSAGNFTKASSLSLPTAQTGAVTVLVEGIKASAPIYFTGVPSDGDTVAIGLTGFVQTYTLRARASSTLVCKATASLSQGGYFDITMSGVVHRFWYDIDAAGTGTPANPGALHEIEIVTGNTDAQVATATELVIEAVTNLSSSATTNTITVVYGILGVMSVTDGPSDTLGTITTVAAGTADAANQIAVDSSAALCLENLRDAINDSVGIEGTDYGTGTTANAFVTAAIVSGVLTYTDKIGCARKLGWDCASSGASIILASPVGGVDGSAVGSVTAGAVATFNTFTLEDESVNLGLLPPLINWTSDAIQVSGKRFSIHLQSSNVATAMASSYEYSTQVSPTVWRAGASSVTSLDNNTQVVTPAEIVEHIRLKINNTNTTAASVNAKVCSE